LNYIEQSFKSAADVSKLLITLSTALIAFCATLVNVTADKAGPLTPASHNQKLLLAMSCALLLAATGVGVWTQLAIADVLANTTPEKKPASILMGKIIFPFRLQIMSFILGVLFLTLYAIFRLFS